MTSPENLKAITDLKDHLTTDQLVKRAFDTGYLQALDLAVAHWPEDRKCWCDPPLSGKWPSDWTTDLNPLCWYYCWLKQAHRTAAINAGEGEEYASTTPY